MTAPSPLVAPVTMVGSVIRLEPYAPALREELRAALDCDSAAWDLFSRSGHGVHFDEWWTDLTAGLRAGTWIPFAVRRLDGAIVGTTSFLNIRADRQVVEIGATFYRPEVRGTAVNPEAKLLMLEHAFGGGARRVELVTDARNLRSRAAIKKLGAVEEGTLRRDRVIWTGHVRDSVMFSVTDLDWPTVRSRLLTRLGR